MRILVVENEKKTTAYLRKGLTEHGFAVDVAAEGTEGLSCALADAYELLILDVMLPGRDGWFVLRELRRAGKDMPVLILTARDAIHDRVKGLELGADDYLVKPFAFSELLARVRSILRRSAGRTPEHLRVGDLEIDVLRRQASRAGKQLNLTPTEFSILVLLAKHCGEVLARSLIAERVWNVQPDPTSNVVDVHVRRLRSKVDDPFQQKLVYTVRGAGYVLRAGD